jgi:succinyl-CoA:(S)-malate CoA-transferase subunit B
VDIGLYESIFRILDELAPAYQVRGYVRERMGPGTVNVVPHSHYPTKDGRWIAIACTSDKIFERLAVLMGEPEIAGTGKWGTIRQREAERAAVDEHVGKWTGRHDRAEVIALCEQGQVPCGPVYSIDEIFEDPHYAARENIARIDDPRVGTLAIPNVVPRLTATPGEIRHLGPGLGTSTDEILTGLLGLPAARVEALRKAGVI